MNSMIEYGGMIWARCHLAYWASSFSSCFLPPDQMPFFPAASPETGKNGVPKDDRMMQSMSPRANCWDNAPMESFFKTLKVERVHLERVHLLRRARHCALRGSFDDANVRRAIEKPFTRALQPHRFPQCRARRVVQENTAGGATGRTPGAFIGGGVGLMFDLFD